jgi:hypothetical protein
MLTYKKIAFVAAAGLAALAIGCSDEGDPAGGKIEGFDVVDAGTKSGGSVTIKGTINGESNVKTIKIKVDGKDVDFVAAPTLNTKVVELNNTLKGKGENVCGSKSTAEEEIKFEIIVGFEADGSGDAKADKKVKINCSGSGSVTPAAGEYTLSNADESFLDPDKGETFKFAQLTSKEIKEGIAVMAYYNGDAGDRFWNPCNSIGANNIEADCGIARLFKSESACKSAAEDANGEATIDIGAVDATFYIESNELDVFKATIKAKGTKSVTIKLDPAGFECGE